MNTVALLLLLAPNGSAAPPAAYESMADVARVFAAVLSEHIVGGDPQQLAARAIDGMLSGLDPYTRRLPAPAPGQVRAVGCLVDRGVLRLTVPRFDDQRQDDWLSACPALNDGLPLLLDLRANPGGRVASAVALADLLVGDVLLFVEHRRGAVIEHRASPRRLAIPGLVVAIDGETASAAEMLATALRSHAGARIVGQPSRGKGTVQQPIFLSDGSLVTITTGHVTSDKNETIQGVGIQPDQPYGDGVTAMTCRHAGGLWQGNQCKLASQ